MDSVILKDYLERKYEQYNVPGFIDDDPISIPHRFNKKGDIEISGFLASTLAWGQRKTIIHNVNKLMQWMDESPEDFILNFRKSDLAPFKKFVHRTFNGEDAVAFMQALQYLYKKRGGLEAAFCSATAKKSTDVSTAISLFRKQFFTVSLPHRTGKHVSDPLKNSSSKRLCMYLRWMVRKDKKGVDFGIWKGLKPHQLCLPLDVHTGNVGRQLGLLQRTQNDWKAVMEITTALKQFDKNDPVKYDFALFGVGVSGELK